MLLFVIVFWLGFEPRIHALKGRCHTTWLPEQIIVTYRSDDQTYAGLSGIASHRTDWIERPELAILILLPLWF